jgi:hypothetical protein
MSTFVSKGNSYQAIGSNHDDLMMNLVMFAWFVTTDIFEGFADVNMKDMLYRERLKAIQDDMLPFGFTPDAEEKPSGERLPGDDNLWFEGDAFERLLR